MSKLASIILNWIGGGKTPIPIRFLKSVDVPGSAPNSGNNIHILEVKGALEQTTDEEVLKGNLFLDGKPFEQNDINKIHTYDTVIRYSYGIGYCYYSISYLYTNNDGLFISIIAGYDSQNLGAGNIIKIGLNYKHDNNYFEIQLIDV